MKTTILALMLSITASGFAQDTCKTDRHGNIKCAMFDAQPKPEHHKFRNVLIGAGVAAGVVAVVVLTRSSQAAPLQVHSYPAPFIPTVAVQK